MPEEQSFVAHLDELRRRLIRVLLVIAVAVIVGMLIANPIIRYIQESGPAADFSLKVFSPWDAVRIYMNVALAVALVIALPYAMLQIWGFVKPGLRREEQVAAVKYVPFVFVLALLGLAFSYFIVFPFAILFSTRLSGSLGLEEMFGISQYFSFLFNIVLPITVLFELPAVVMFLTKIRLLNPRRLGQFRKFAYFILFVLGALVTPPDILSAILVTIPMMGLYEISVLLSRIVYSKQQAADTAALKET
ncbi:twin-arginine translocase subunit TatC [Xylanibacillus composti]|uniref:Sec-independent protein translocase protein TatC n=1 Tax=Xylanibacillus composti TaxID=1572762 RepID=A0A8J4H0Y5_9BACL|nr:twin-arginine translocase subunit TatC [Xylanibacillus composti]MDT9723831.1 twin-arginine translocase subunit TatC [Xylanibacillus composti]GIQ67391.1 Sec-independent protein translocase protein TatCy [Xylanibacillus composti]